MEEREGGRRKGEREVRKGGREISLPWPENCVLLSWVFSWALENTAMRIGSRSERMHFLQGQEALESRIRGIRRIQERGGVGTESEG